MVRDNNYFVAIPNFGALAEFAFENTDGSRAADIVRHEHVGVYPNVVSGLHARFASGAGEDFFSQCHIKSWRQRQDRQSSRPPEAIQPLWRHKRHKAQHMSPPRSGVLKVAVWLQPRG